MAIIAAIAASFAVAYCTAAEGDGDDDPVAGGLLLVVDPQPVATSKADDRPNAPRNLQGDIFAGSLTLRATARCKVAIPFNVFPL